MIGTEETHSALRQLATLAIVSRSTSVISLRLECSRKEYLVLRGKDHVLRELLAFIVDTLANPDISIEPKNHAHAAGKNNEMRAAALDEERRNLDQLAISKLDH